MIVPDEYPRPFPEWLDGHLRQIGIYVRQSGQHQEMRLYLELLKDEILTTEDFLAEDNVDT